ncbi:MAG: alkaline phosphatase family protein [Deltaproteobacteria bacterium]|nr:alkaline phosphatase family protein [Deltaproteobacteria bacterium]
MRRTCIGAAVFLVAMAVALMAGSEGKEPPVKNVILIGWDGAGRQNVKEGLEAGYLPALQRLKDEGSLVAIDILRTTDTKAGWTQILTGYEPEKTGVFSNKRYEPIPKGYTLFERLEKFFGPSKILTAAVISKKVNMGTDGPRIVPLKKGQKAKYQVTLDGKDYEAFPGKPYFHTHGAVDIFINGLHWDKDVGKKALALIEQNKDRRFFFFVHFGEVDRKGHMFGENSSRYVDAMKSADTWTGRILDKLEALGMDEETLVYVTSDHGFDEDGVKHFDAPYVWLATNDGGVMRRGNREDIAPTIMSRFGMDLDSVEPALDGKPLTQPFTPPIW